MRYIMLLAVLVLGTFPFLDKSYAANEVPSISEFTNCVGFFNRTVRAREKGCKSWEFEVKIDGDAGNGGEVECPCFNDFRLRNTLFSIFPFITSESLCFSDISTEQGSALAISVFEILPDTPFPYAAAFEDNFAGINRKFCNLRLSDDTDAFENFEELALIDSDEANACEALIQNWINDASIQECE